MNTQSLDSSIENIIAPAASWISKLVFFEIPLTSSLSVPAVIVWLIMAALFFSFYFRFISLWGFGIGLKIVSGKFKIPGQGGEVSHFQALATALSGTVGVGNIGAVAIAVSVGGPGAVFWLIIAGFLGMTTKFVECSLGLKYRRTNADGTVSGGPMFFLAKGLSDLKFEKTGKALACFYALGIVAGCLGIGNMFQANQAYVQFSNIMGRSALTDNAWLFGLVFAILIGLVIMGGIKSIAKVTEKLVPFMAVTYLLGAIAVIILNYQFIPVSIVAIFKGAFMPEGVRGGMLGVLFWGFKRALLSNEAGIGSASIAHSAVRTSEPISEGFVSLLEPFIDTVVICTITALVIVTSMYAYPEIFTGIEPGVAMTSSAFAAKMPWAPIPLALIIMLFAFSTIISWGYYGLKGWTYLLGESKFSQSSFKIFYCLFVILGCSVPVRSIIEFSDAMVFLICIPNIIGLYMLAPSVKRDLKQFLLKYQEELGGAKTKETTRAFPKSPSPEETLLVKNW